MIRIIRRYYQYNMINSCTYEVSHEITCRITDNPKIILLPINGYKGDLRITNSEGEEMILLSDVEFEREYGFSISEVNKKYLEGLHRGLSVDNTQQPTKQVSITKDHRLIAIILPKANLQNEIPDYFEKIKLSWVERIEKRTRDKISEFVKIPIQIHRYGFEKDQYAATYLSIKIADKYEITKKPDFVDFLTKSGVKFTEILNDPIHQIYRLEETKKAQYVEGEVKIGVPKRLIRWMQAGIIASIFISVMIVGLILIVHRLPPFTFEALGGVIVFLIGERIIILQDLSLMKIWNSIHIFAAGGCVTLMVCLIVLISNGSLFDPQYIIPIVTLPKT